jgi:hypothetical protein
MAVRVRRSRLGWSRSRPLKQVPCTSIRALVRKRCLAEVPYRGDRGFQNENQGKPVLADRQRSIVTSTETPALENLMLEPSHPGFATLYSLQSSPDSASKPAMIHELDEDVVPLELCREDSQSPIRSRACAKRKTKPWTAHKSKAGTHPRPARRSQEICLTSKARTMGSRENFAAEESQYLVALGVARPRKELGPHARIKRKRDHGRSAGDSRKGCSAIGGDGATNEMMMWYECARDDVLSRGRNKAGG